MARRKPRKRRNRPRGRKRKTPKNNSHSTNEKQLDVSPSVSVMAAMLFESDAVAMAEFHRSRVAEVTDRIKSLEALITPTCLDVWGDMDQTHISLTEQLVRNTMPPARTEELARNIMPSAPIIEDILPSMSVLQNSLFETQTVLSGVLGTGVESIVDHGYLVDSNQRFV